MDIGVGIADMLVPDREMEWKREEIPMQTKHFFENRAFKVGAMVLFVTAVLSLDALTESAADGGSEVGDAVRAELKRLIEEEGVLDYAIV